MSRLEDYGYSKRISDSEYKEGLFPARVLSESRGIYRLVTDEGELNGEVLGKLQEPKQFHRQLQLM